MSVFQVSDLSVSAVCFVRACFVNIQYCAKVMQTKFVEIRPLFLRSFNEKSSNFQKMFRGVLSEKFTIFRLRSFENSR